MIPLEHPTSTTGSRRPAVTDVTTAPGRGDATDTTHQAVVDRLELGDRAADELDVVSRG